MFPEELIYAAGIHPVQIYPLLEEMITEADAHLQTFLCSYVRAVWDQLIKGKAPYLDGIIIPRSCEAVTFLYQTWKRNNPLPFTDYINVPWKRSENTILFFTKELERIKNHLETFTGKEISNEAIGNAIAIHNRHRSLMRRVYDLQKAESPPFSGLETFQMAMSGFLLDKEEHLKLMEQVFTEIDKRPTPSKSNVRLLLSGGCVIDVTALGNDRILRGLHCCGRCHQRRQGLCAYRGGRTRSPCIPGPSLCIGSLRV